MAAVSPPRSALWMLWSAARFSASRCAAVTRKPSSGGVGSLTGSPRLRGRRQVFRFRGLEPSHVGEPSVRVRLCPFVPSASFSRWHFWERPGAEEGEGPSWLTFLEDFWTGRAGDLAVAVAVCLSLCAGGKPPVELYELVMAFLLGLGISTEVWDFLSPLSSETSLWGSLCRSPGLGMRQETARARNADRGRPVPSGFLPVSPEMFAWRMLCRVPGLGTKTEWPPWTRRGLKADRAGPVPSGFLP